MENNLQRYYSSSYRFGKYKGKGVLKGRLYKTIYFRSCGKIRMLSIRWHNQVWITHKTLCVLLFQNPKFKIDTYGYEQWTHVPVWTTTRFGFRNGFAMRNTRLYNLEAAKKIAQHYERKLCDRIFRLVSDLYLPSKNFSCKSTFSIQRNFRRYRKNLKTIVFFPNEL